MKLCTTCDLVKDVSEFNKNKAKTDGLGTKCRDCMRAYRKEHYKAHKPELVQKAMARNRVVRVSVQVEMLGYLLDHPCVDCGNADPRVLEFDHRDRLTKTYNIGRRVNSGYLWKDLLTEIELCDVRCKNCHVIRTQGQLGSFRSQWTMDNGVYADMVRRHSSKVD